MTYEMFHGKNGVRCLLLKEEKIQSLKSKIGKEQCLIKMKLITFADKN